MFKTAYDREFDALMLRPHFLEVEVSLMNGNGEDAIDISDRFMDGQVSYDTEASVTRALDLTLFDPNRRLQLDLGSPQKTSVFLDQRVKVVYTIIDPENGERYSCPVFTGGIDDVARDEVFVMIKALGMEAHAVGNSWRAKVYKKKTKKTQVIRAIITNFVGLDRMRVADLKALLPNDAKLNRERAPWPLAVKIADSMGRQLFVNGNGTGIMRKKTKNVKHTFNDKWLTSQPKVEYDLTNVTNVVLVIGKKPSKKGTKGTSDRSDKKRPRPKYKAVAPKKHPLSPKKLGRNGVPRYLWTVIEDDNLRSVKECRARARQVLSRGLDAGVDMTWSGIPQPRLEELDMVAVSTVNVFRKMPMRKWTLPLKAGQDAEYGSLTRIKLRKTKKRDESKKTGRAA
jgi:hypothetical protein